MVLLQKVIGYPFDPFTCGNRELHATPSMSAIQRWENFILKVHKIENFFDSDFGICVISLLVSRTYGASIFIDYCTALSIQRKVEGEERDTGLKNKNEVSSCIAYGYMVPHGLR